MGATSVRILGNKSCTDNTSDPLLQRCFTIVHTTPNTATIKYWFTEAERNGQDANGLQLWHWDGTWSPVGTSSYGETGTPCTSEATCWFEVTGVSTFSPFSSGSGATPTGNPSTPLAVTLANFEAISADDHVLVRWETVRELDNLGFNLYRNTTAAMPSSPLNSELIPSQAPGSGQGSVYEYQDNDVEADTTYYYWLEDVDTNGTTTRDRAVSVTYEPAPTAVTVDSLATQSTSPALPLALASLVVTALIGATLVWRRRR
jgi:hypothetical protein